MRFGDWNIRLRLRDSIGRKLRSTQPGSKGPSEAETGVTKVTPFCFACCYANRFNIDLTETFRPPNIALPPF